MRALLSGDSERFYEEETNQRRRAGLPPFGRLAALIVSGKDSASAEVFARALARAAFALPPSDGWALTPAGALPKENELSLLGPAEAPIAVIRGRHRFRLWCGRPARPIYKDFCAHGSRRGRRKRAACGSPSMSIRKAFCDLSLAEAGC